jgi:hypothetical protein
MRGGPTPVNIVGSVIFAGMSGAAIAHAAGLGTIEIKAMKDHGYDTVFSVGVTAASSVLTTARVTEYATEALLAVTDNRDVILLLANVVLLEVGCFLEPIASISILVPVLISGNRCCDVCLMAKNLRTNARLPVMQAGKLPRETSDPRDGRLGRCNMLVYGFASSKSSKNSTDGMKRGF